MNNKETDIHRVERALSEKGISVPELQRLLKIQSQHWNNWKKRGIPGKRLIEIASKLEVDAMWIEKGDRNKEPEWIKKECDKNNIREEKSHYKTSVVACLPTRITTILETIEKDYRAGKLNDKDMELLETISKRITEH